MKRRVVAAIISACSFVAGCGNYSIFNPNTASVETNSITDEFASAEAELVAEIVTNGAAVELENPSFEAGWRGWNEVHEGQDETAISDIGLSGAKSAKITGTGGRFEQSVTVFPNSNYELRAHVRGHGTIGVDLGGETLVVNSSDKGDNWSEVSLPFQSGAQREASIFGAFVKDDVRFDDFALVAVGGQALVAEAEKQKTALRTPKSETVTYKTLEGACRGVNELKLLSISREEQQNTPVSNRSTVSRRSPLDGVVVLDFGSIQTLKEIGIAWQVSDSKAVEFDVEGSLNGRDFELILQRGERAVVDPGMKSVDFNDTLARFIRVTSYDSQSSEPVDVVELAAYGCGSSQYASVGGKPGVADISAFGLDRNAAPSENFDLTDWKLTLPVDRDHDGKADEINEPVLAEGWTDPALFYTDPVTGGMVFRTPQKPFATTTGPRYLRTELREMLRAGDLSIDTRNNDGTPNKNNWVLPSAPLSAKANAGGVGGVLHATLAINQVTRLGDPQRVGRVIIGQIHAKDNEPLRLYYRKLPMNKFGSIYYAHETPDGKEVYVDIIGSSSDTAANPDDGIALDETFSYDFRVDNEIIDQKQRSLLRVKIIRDDGTEIDSRPLDLTDTGYAVDDNFLYFKAGSYSQNDSASWQEHDADQVTFYKIDNTHETVN